MKTSEEVEVQERGKPKQRNEYQDKCHLSIWIKLWEAGRENALQTSNDAQLTCEEADYIFFNEQGSFKSPFLSTL